MLKGYGVALVTSFGQLGLLYRQAANIYGLLFNGIWIFPGLP